eukprot:TRINITY_DN390_c0_g1_i2.p1 TRINITY_DN390_c0_g1~~TRINITY_DN390_c0_g1_i2.p1  ORF type:complete len:1548 (+),score=404.37 TRINITY_DN390_c0_g1_i2:112-4644(+)
MFEETRGPSLDMSCLNNGHMNNEHDDGDGENDSIVVNSSDDKDNDIANDDDDDDNSDNDNGNNTKEDSAIHHPSLASSITPGLPKMVKPFFRWVDWAKEHKNKSEEVMLGSLFHEGVLVRRVWSKWKLAFKEKSESLIIPRQVLYDAVKHVSTQQCIRIPFQNWRMLAVQNKEDAKLRMIICRMRFYRMQRFFFRKWQDAYMNNMKVVQFREKSSLSLRSRCWKIWMKHRWQERLVIQFRKQSERVNCRIILRQWRTERRIRSDLKQKSRAFRCRRALRHWHKISSATSLSSDLQSRVRLMRLNRGLTQWSKWVNNHQIRRNETQKTIQRANWNLIAKCFNGWRNYLEERKESHALLEEAKLQNNHFMLLRGMRYLWKNRLNSVHSRVLLASSREKLRRGILTRTLYSWRQLAKSQKGLISQALEFHDEHILRRVVRGWFRVTVCDSHEKESIFTKMKMRRVLGKWHNRMVRLRDLKEKESEVSRIHRQKSLIKYISIWSSNTLISINDRLKEKQAIDFHSNLLRRRILWALQESVELKSKRRIMNEQAKLFNKRRHFVRSWRIWSRSFEFSSNESLLNFKADAHHKQHLIRKGIQNLRLFVSQQRHSRAVNEYVLLYSVRRLLTQSMNNWRQFVQESKRRKEQQEWDAEDFKDYWRKRRGIIGFKHFFKNRQNSVRSNRKAIHLHISHVKTRVFDHWRKHAVKSANLRILSDDFITDRNTKAASSVFVKLKENVEIKIQVSEMREKADTMCLNKRYNRVFSQLWNNRDFHHRIKAAQTLRSQGIIREVWKRWVEAKILVGKEHKVHSLHEAYLQRMVIREWKQNSRIQHELNARHDAVFALISRNRQQEVWKLWKECALANRIERGRIMAVEIGRRNILCREAFLKWKCSTNDYLQKCDNVNKKIESKNLSLKRHCWLTLQRFVVSLRISAARTSEADRRFATSGLQRGLRQLMLWVVDKKDDSRKRALAKDFERSHSLDKFLQLWRSAVEYNSRIRESQSAVIEMRDSNVMCNAMKQWMNVWEEKKTRHRMLRKAVSLQESILMKRGLNRLSKFVVLQQQKRVLKAQSDREMMNVHFAAWKRYSLIRKESYRQLSEKRSRILRNVFSSWHQHTSLKLKESHFQETRMQNQLKTSFSTWRQGTNYNHLKELRTEAESFDKIRLLRSGLNGFLKHHEDLSNTHRATSIIINNQRQRIMESSFDNWRKIFKACTFERAKLLRSVLVSWNKHTVRINKIKKTCQKIKNQQNQEIMKIQFQKWREDMIIRRLNSIRQYRTQYSFFQLWQRRTAFMQAKGIIISRNTPLSIKLACGALNHEYSSVSNSRVFFLRWKQYILQRHQSYAMHDRALIQWRNQRLRKGMVAWKRELSVCRVGVEVYSVTCLRQLSRSFDIWKQQADQRQLQRIGLVRHAFTSWRKHASMTTNAIHFSAVRLLKNSFNTWKIKCASQMEAVATCQEIKQKMLLKEFWKKWMIAKSKSKFNRHRAIVWKVFSSWRMHSRESSILRKWAVQ